MNEEYENDVQETTPRKRKPGLTHSRDLVHYINRSQTYPSNNSRSVALYIADYYNPKKGYAFPSQEQMAEDFSVHPPTIRRWLKELASTGYWTITKGGLNNSSRYAPSSEELKKIEKFLDAESRNERLNDRNPRLEPSKPRNDRLAVVAQTRSHGKKAPEDAVEEVDETTPATGETEPTRGEVANYQPAPLPDTVPANLDALFEAMIPYGIRAYKEPRGFSKLNASQQDLIGIMISHLLQSGLVAEKERDSIVRKMSETWLKHPDTDREIFYNRFMHHLVDNHMPAKT